MASHGLIDRDQPKGVWTLTEAGMAEARKLMVLA
jgi:hypothetical protein